MYNYFSMSIILVCAVEILSGLSVEEEKEKEAREGR